LPLAVASVQAQGIEDIEILIIGDGVDDPVRSTVERLRTADARIRFFDFPKGPRNGEIHRDGVLRQARGRIVCYQADDDLWLPGHFEDIERALENADFVGAMHVNVEFEDRIRGYFFDIERPEFKDLWVAWQAHPYGPWASNGFGLACAGHRPEAYLRLPEGWTTTPTGLSTDQFMWMKFARQPWCRIRALQWPVSLHFPAPDRRNWTEQQRVDELARWADIIARPGGREHVYRAMLRTFGDIMLDHGLMVMQQQAAAAAAAATALEGEQALRAKAEGERDAEQTLRTKAEAERAAEQTLRARAEVGRDAEQGVRTYAQAERDAEQMLRAQVEAERDAMRESTFWRLTGPLRAMINLFKGL
jgi:GalNAc5-diNAcBac-PP-undecaprenol beta-1,3-glucosyltransferase